MSWQRNYLVSSLKYSPHHYWKLMVSRDQHSPQSSGMPEGKTVPLTDKRNGVGILCNRMGLSVYNPAKPEIPFSHLWLGRFPPRIMSSGSQCKWQSWHCCGRGQVSYNLFWGRLIVTVDFSSTEYQYFSCVLGLDEFPSHSYEAGIQIHVKFSSLQAP